MIVDSSALISILRDELESEEFSNLLETAPSVSMSAGTLLESSIVLTERYQPALDSLVSALAARIAPFDEQQARAARRAYAQFGKGSGSLARLNFGDCMAYALAKTTGETLLFKGTDFTHTDITAAR